MDAPSEYVSSYDPAAPVPEAGSFWTWEKGKPYAHQNIRVTDVKWNGEEWWVEAAPIGVPYSTPSRDLGSRYWNDLSRFWEAVTPLRVAA